MPLEDLADVTRSLRRLLELNVGRLISPMAVTVTAEPPELVDEGAANTLSLHLYHVAEDAYYKNLPGPGSDPPNAAKNPMGLCLYYILTAHQGASEGTQNVLMQQRLFGHALKTFHDHPVITERTRVEDALIWPDNPADEAFDEFNHLRDNKNQIQIFLRPITPEDALAFWGTEQRQTTRLSAYYECRVVFLEPERPRRIPGIVLEVGQFVFQLGSPSLDASRSRIQFIVPGPGGGIRASQVSPARVTLNSAPVPPPHPPEHNRLELLGTNLGVGTSRMLLLSAAHWEAEVPVDTSLPENSDWSVVFGANRIDVIMAPQLRAGGADQPVLPGIYTVRVTAVVAEQVLAGELRQLPVSSNAITFAVAPRLAGSQQPDVDDASLIRILIGGEFSLTDPLLDEERAIQVIVDGLPYERVANPPGAAQQFSVITDAVRLNPHAGLSTPGLHPFRLLVNGAESAPFWIEVP